MQSYLAIVKNVLDRGERKDNRTGIRTKAIAGTFFEHNMQEGFPLLTTKKIPFRLVASELEFFIKGITDKERLLARITIFETNGARLIVCLIVMMLRRRQR